MLEIYPASFLIIFFMRFAITVLIILLICKMRAQLVFVKELDKDYQQDKQFEKLPASYSFDDGRQSSTAQSDLGGFLEEQQKQQLDENEDQQQYALIDEVQQYHKANSQENIGDKKTISQLDINNQFQKFKQEQKKSYNPQEQHIRYQIFKNEYKSVQQFNQKNESYEKGTNQFSDMSEQQFANMVLMDPNINQNEPKLMTVKSVAELQQNSSNGIEEYFLDYQPIDWSQHVKFGPIKQQGNCAACYAFSVIGSVEINTAIYKKMIYVPSFSEQQIIDCCGPSGFQCQGCKSGKMGSTLKYLANRGIANTSIYPYRSNSVNCRQQFQSQKYISTSLPYEQTYGVQNVIYYLRRGPVSAGVDSSGWKNYKKGIFTGCVKQNSKFTHAIVIFGVEADGTWLIRNSWGSGWGNRGYMRLQAGNSCGVCNYVFLPIIN